MTNMTPHQKTIKQIRVKAVVAARHAEAKKMTAMYVKVIAVKVTHKITVRIHMNNLWQKGKPVTRSKIMLNDPTKPIVLLNK